MKIVIQSFLLLLLASNTAYAQAESPLLKQADALYEKGDEAGARALYQQAAEQGDAVAEFNLAYKYIVSEDEAIQHYSAAAVQGHAEALAYALDHLLFRADSLTRADPARALALYDAAMRTNPGLDLYDGQNKLAVMQMAVESSDFDVEAFLKRYHLNMEERHSSYDIWELAEEASVGGRFGKPDPKLVFNLVVRGGSVPAELASAIRETYQNWKQGKVQPFVICDHVTSGMGMGYCTASANDEDKLQRDKTLSRLKSTLSKPNARLLDKAYAAAVKFIEAKASNEEGHGGSGRPAWIIESEIEQKNAYLKLIEQVINGYQPAGIRPVAVADQGLNDTYKTVMNKLKTTPNSVNVGPDEVRAVQRLWIPYRDASIKLFTSLNPVVSAEGWNSWLTDRRSQQLASVMELYF